MKNLNLLFNKLYYSELPSIDYDLIIKGGNLKKAVEKFDDSLTEKNADVLNAVFNHETDYAGLDEDVAPHQFLMQVAFPGLVLGIGNAHGTHLSRKDFNVGFAFEYVTGQPYIPASSIKGMVKNVFRDYPEVISEIAQDIAGAEVDPGKLEREIFLGGDVFFDAVIYDGDKVGKLMGTDFIAPQSSPLKAPIPIMFLKVLPEVRFKFAFKFAEAEGCTLNAQQKTELVCRLIELFGIGGKTNLGYGNLKHTNDYTIPEKTIIRSVITCETCGKEYHLTPAEKQNAFDKRKPVKWCKECRVNHYKQSISEENGGQNENI